MQTIMRRVETEQKQVTFKNISPVIEEESDKKVKPTVAPSSIGSTCVISKPTPIPEISKLNEASASANTLVTVQNRLPLMSPIAVGGQNQSAPVQNQQKTAKLPPNSVALPPQVNQLAGKDQSIAPIPQQMLPQMQHAGVGPAAQQSQQQAPPPLGPICFPNQSFNVQNPQFTKNFMANRPPASAPRYQMQAQGANGQQPASAAAAAVVAPMSQTVGMHLAINQSRPLHQRMPQNVPPHSSPAQLLQQQQQNMRLGSPSMMPQGINLQAAGVAMQPGMSMEQQNHVMGLQQQQQQQSAMQSNARPSNGMHSQLGVNGATANVSMIPALSAYNKDPAQLQQQQQQQQITTLANASSSPTAASNFQLNFNQANYSQSVIGAQPAPLSQNQPSPSSFYKKKTDAIDFPFPNQANVTKNHQSQQQQQQQLPAANNYNMFCNYEPTEHFNLWNDNRPPQPPITWWGLTNTNQAAHMHPKSSSTVADNAFSNWSNSSNPGSIAGRAPASLTSCNNYQQQQQNAQHGRRLIAGNSFEDSRLFDVSTVAVV